MKQPFIDSLFNILDLCRQRQNIDEQSGKQTKTTSVWHPIIGHVRGKTSGMTVLVYFQYLFVLFSEKSRFSDLIKKSFNVLLFNINIFGQNHLFICYLNQFHPEINHHQ
jgi:hypothetical protein